MKPIKYKISLKFPTEDIKNTDLLEIQRLTQRPLSEIKESATTGIKLGTIENKKLYSGVKDIVNLIRSLKSEYIIYSNTSEININFLQEIIEKISNIKIEDIR